MPGIYYISDYNPCLGFNRNIRGMDLCDPWHGLCANPDLVLLISLPWIQGTTGSYKPRIHGMVRRTCDVLWIYIVTRVYTLVSVHKPQCVLQQLFLTHWAIREIRDPARHKAIPRAYKLGPMAWGCFPYIWWALGWGRDIQNTPETTSSRYIRPFRWFSVLSGRRY